MKFVQIQIAVFSTVQKGTQEDVTFKNSLRDANLQLTVNMTTQKKLISKLVMRNC